MEVENSEIAWMWIKLWKGDKKVLIKSIRRRIRRKTSYNDVKTAETTKNPN